MNLNNDPRGLTACLCKAGLVLGDGTKTGTATAAPNGAGVDYCIKGIVYHLADAADNIPLTAAPAQGLLTSCLYAICINAAGTRLSVQGNPVLTADMVAGAAVLDWPLAPADYCVLGYVRVDTASTANFTPGTTALDAANVTETYIDVFTPPIEPLLV